MKKILFGAIVATVPLLALVGHSQGTSALEPKSTESPTPLHWYRLDLDNEPDVIGSSESAPAEISAKLAKGEFIGLSGYVWAEGENLSGNSMRKNESNPQIWIRPSLIRTYRVLDGKPE